MIGYVENSMSLNEFILLFLVLILVFFIIAKILTFIILFVGKIRRFLNKLF